MVSDEEKAEKANLARTLSRRLVLKEGMSDDLGPEKDATKKPTEEKKPASKVKLAGWKHFLAGAVAGACEVIGTMPLDVVKTQMQINPGKYKGPISAMGQIYRMNGFPGLYYGMPAFLIQTSGKAAIRFTAFAQIKEALSLIFGAQAVEKDYQVATNLFCGLMAGAAEAAFWTTPTERLKVLRQADIGGAAENKGLFRSAVAVVNKGGFGSLFVGLVPTVIRQGSSVGIRFMLYDPVKQLINYISPGDQAGTLTYMAAGGTVGGLSVALNNPVDVIKNIAQSGKSQTKGTINIAKMVYKENGIPGFFRGLSARVPRVFCGQAITFAAYEQMAAFLMNV